MKFYWKAFVLSFVLYGIDPFFPINPLNNLIKHRPRTIDLSNRPDKTSFVHFYTNFVRYIYIYIQPSWWKKNLIIWDQY